jgi:5-(aminomethyl)-3-furanmethanol phosphate kinase
LTSPPSSASGRSAKPTVVKLGGSLAESGRLPKILQIVGAARAPLVIVPGGGEFADAVRRAQADYKFSDAAAHRMALLAMHQTGLMLAALHKRLEPFETLAGLRRALKGGRVPVWLPFKMIESDKRVPADWTATSDGLAARLAERLGGAPVVLVKSCRIRQGATVVALARAGVVDATFAAIVKRARLQWRLVGEGDDCELATLLRADGASLPALPGNRSRMRLHTLR